MWIFVVSVICLLVLVLKQCQKKLLVCYYASKLPGPISVPFIGSISLLKAITEDMYKTIYKICESQPPVFRLWIRTDLYIVNSQPEDLEILLGNCLGKADFYKIWDDVLDKTILTAPVSKWKEVRKIMNPQFNPQLLNSFQETFVKSSKNIVAVISDLCGTEVTDLVSVLWKCNLDLSIETLTDTHDFSIIEDRHDFIPLITRAEQILTERFQKPWLLVDFLWQVSGLRKELMWISGRAHDYGSKILIKKKEEWDALGDDLWKKKSFMYTLYHLLIRDKTITEIQFMEEMFTLLIAASETSSIVLSFVLVVLGLYPDIQDRIFQEVSSVAADPEQLSSQDVASLSYLERVIKETMRVFAPGPIVMRSVDQDIRIGSNMFPAGSNLIIPIGYLHRRPDLWPDPTKFDPDRFLPEEVQKRPRCAYIPFSFGPRNCIGPKYAMVFMKTMLAHVVTNFKIKPLNYTCLEEIQTEYHFMMKPTGYRVVFERREN